MEYLGNLECPFFYCMPVFFVWFLYQDIIIVADAATAGDDDDEMVKIKTVFNAMIMKFSSYNKSHLAGISLK